MRNCYDCKHGVIKLKNEIDNEKIYSLLHGNIYLKCNKNNTIQMIKFYKKYDNKTKEDAKDFEINCHEYCSSIKVLHNSINNFNFLLRHVLNEC